MEQELRRMFEMKEVEMNVPPTLSPELRSRIGRQRMFMGGLAAAAAIAVVIGGFAGARSLSSDDAAPVPPAKQEEQGTPSPETTVDERIISGDRGVWSEGTAPPPPGEESYYTWDAFDQDTGSFLFVTQPDLRTFWVVRDDGRVAEFDCAPVRICKVGRGRFALGPDPGAVTVPMDGQPQSATIVALDGEGASCCFSPPLAQGQQITDIAWSPDESRLAVAAHPRVGYVCDGDVPCEASVWISDRERPTWELVYSERADDAWVMNGPPTIVELAWSPDARSLAVVSAPDDLSGAVDKGVWPRLVAIRLQPGQPAHSETLHIYDDYDWQKKEPAALGADDDDVHFAFAWAPDGTRIAVTSRGGLAEISAEDGRVLAEQPGDGVHGPLAWLRER